MGAIFLSHILFSSSLLLKGWVLIWGVYTREQEFWWVSQNYASYRQYAWIWEFEKILPLWKPKSFRNPMIWYMSSGAPYTSLSPGISWSNKGWTQYGSFLLLKTIKGLSIFLWGDHVCNCLLGFKPWRDLCFFGRILIFLFSILKVGACLMSTNMGEVTLYLVLIQT